MRIINIALLINGTGEQPARRQAIVIEGPRLGWIGSQAELKQRRSDPSEEVIDAQGCTVLPGFMDSHVHLHSPSAGSDPEHSHRKHKYFDPVGVTALRMARNAQLALTAGLTTLRDCGSRDGLARQIRDSVSMGLLVAPRILAAGRPITTSSGHDALIGYKADSVEEVCKGVITEIKAGSDFIKIMATGGFSTPGSSVLEPQYSAEILTAAVKEAHGLGRRVAAHVYGIPGIQNCVDAGVDSLEHCLWLRKGDATYGTGYDESLAAEMASKGLFLVTALGHGERLKYRRAQKRGAEFYERYLYERSAHHENIKKMLAAGVKLCVGTDAGAGAIRIDEVASNIPDLIEFLELAPMEAISTITRNPAEMMGISDRVGTLEVGKEADLVILDGNPLSDPEDLKHVRTVVCSGKVVFRDGQIVTSF